MLIKLAFRNVFRNRRRTLLSLLLIAVGTATLFVVGGYMDDAYYRLRHLAIDTYGDLQIARSSYWNHTYRGYSYLIGPDDVSRIAGFLRAQPEFQSLATELSVAGLIGNRENSTNLLASGIESDREELAFPLVQGRALQAGDLGQAVIGEAMAQQLGAHVGDYLSLAMTTVNGAFNAGSVQVVGIFKGLQPAEDEHFGYITLALAQRLLGTQGIERLVVHLNSDTAAEEVGKALQSTFNAEDLDLQVKTWSDLAVFYHQVRAFWRVMFGFMTTAIFILVFVSIMELMTMSFF